ncbi:MAG TPA: ABC transporter permease subunit [Candidatus Butyricicoccus stercorigallinarum]|nr:ABC transporter permease subunit [Candidatus Butyricicoccus stercorigallinarum]
MKKSTKRVLAMCLACLAVLGGMFFPVTKPAQAADVINVGTNAEFPPFEYIGNDGEPDGFDMAVIKAIGEAEGFEVKITNMEFKSLIASLATGSLDAVIAGMTVTEERQQSVDFSDSYYTATQCIVVKQDSDITGLADLNGKKIAVQEGTTGDLLCTPGEDNDIITDESTQVQRYKKGTDAIVTLNNGGVDAVVIDKNPAENFVANNSDTLKLIEDDTSTEEYAIAVAKGDTELLDRINSGLQKIKEDGTFDRLVAEYIGGDTEEEPAAEDGERLVINVGTNAEFPPFEYIGDDGEPDGFDMAVIQAIGEAAGFDVEITNMEFKSLIASLATGSLDAVIAGMTVTEERQQSVDFSDSYYTATQCIVVSQDSDITGLADLNGKKIAVQEGTTGDLLCTPGEDNDIITDESTQVQRFKKGTDAIVTLNNGGVDAVVIDKNPAENFVASNSDTLKLIEDETSTEEYAIAVAKGNTELLDRINSGLAQIKEDGTFDALVAQYIEGSTTTEQETSDNPFVNFVSNLKYVFVDTNGYQLMLRGLGVTIGISICAGVLGIALGFVLALMKLTETRKKRKTLLSRIAGAYIDIIRGTPAMVQLLIIFMVIFRSQYAYVAAILSFGINSGAYVAENIRAGILAVDAGQMEGGRSLGFTYGETMRYIILPQAIKNVIPALGNEMITLVKETSIVGYVAIVDLTKAGDFIVSRTYQAFLPLIAVAIVYYIIVKIMTKILAAIERRLRQSDNR